MRIVAVTIAAVGVGVAASGLWTWKAQLRGKTEYEVARRVLRAALWVRDEISVVRTPMIFTGEMVAAFQDAGLDSEKIEVMKDSRTNQLVYSRRWKSLMKAMSDFSAELLEAEALWGSKVREPERQLRGCVAELGASIMMYFRDLSPHASEATIELHESSSELFTTPLVSRNPMSFQVVSLRQSRPLRICCDHT